MKTVELREFFNLKFDDFTVKSNFDFILFEKRKDFTDLLTNPDSKRLTEDVEPPFSSSALVFDLRDG